MTLAPVGATFLRVGGAAGVALVLDHGHLGLVLVLGGAKIHLLHVELRFTRARNSVHP